MCQNQVDQPITVIRIGHLRTTSVGKHVRTLHAVTLSLIHVRDTLSVCLLILRIWTICVGFWGWSHTQGYTSCLWSHAMPYCQSCLHINVQLSDTSAGLLRRIQQQIVEQRVPQEKDTNTGNPIHKSLNNTQTQPTFPSANGHHAYAARKRRFSRIFADARDPQVQSSTTADMPVAIPATTRRHYWPEFFSF